MADDQPDPTPEQTPARRRADRPRRRKNDRPPDGGEPDADRILAYGWSGPLPHPSDLAEFDRMCPGSAGRIIDNMLAESKRRRIDQKHAARAEIKDAERDRDERDRGQHYGLAIGLVAILGGVAVTLCGHGGTGGVIGGGGVVALVTVFITGRAVTDGVLSGDGIQRFLPGRPRRDGPDKKADGEP